MRELALQLAVGIGQPHSEVPTRAVNHTSQAVITILAVAAVLGVVVAGARMARARGSLVPLAIVAGCGLGTICEPQWNASFHLFWYAPGQIRLWESYGYPQPLWVAGIYIVIYAGPALFLWTLMERGAFTREVLYRTVAIASLAIAVLEISVISSGVYRYYGPLQFRFITDYPLWCAVMEGAFIGIFAAVAAKVGPLLGRGASALLMIPLFLLTFCGVFFGGAMPALAVLNKAGTSSALQYVGVVAALVVTGSMVWLAGQLLPSAKGAGAHREVRLQPQQG